MSTKICTLCSKRKSLKDFINKTGKRITKQCAYCRKARGKNRKTERYQAKTEKPRPLICPFEKGDVQPVPYGGIM